MPVVRKCKNCGLRITSKTQVCPSCGAATSSEVKAEKSSSESNEFNDLKTSFIKFMNNDFEVSRDSHRANLINNIESLEVPATEEGLIGGYDQIMNLLENLPKGEYKLESALIEKLRKTGRALLVSYPNGTKARSIKEDLDIFDTEEKTNYYIGTTLVVVSLAMVIMIFVLLSR